MCTTWTHLAPATKKKYIYITFVMYIFEKYPTQLVKQLMWQKLVAVARICVRLLLCFTLIFSILIYLFIRDIFIHLFMELFIIYSWVRSFTCGSIHSFIHRFIHSSIHLFMGFLVMHGMVHICIDLLMNQRTYLFSTKSLTVERPPTA